MVTDKYHRQFLFYFPNFDLNLLSHNRILIPGFKIRAGPIMSL